MLGKFSVKKPYTVLVAVVLVIVLGVVSFTKMSTDLLPSISLPYVIVMTTYPGASPETVEMVVTKPVEASMATVSNIEEISSVSSENYSVVILEFAQSTDMNAASLEIRENLDQIKSYWSDSVGNPIIMKLNPDMLPIMIAAVGGIGMTDAEVSEMTQNTVIPELESIEGVASASATGLLEESVNVIIRQEKIDAINVKVFGYIDDEMKDAEKELADARQEIIDGQAEINDAKAELEDSKKELVDSQKELDDSRTELKDGKQKIIDGKNEIEENKTKLEEGKNELANKKDETAKQLAEAEKKILTAKADLEATKMHITMEIETIKASVEGLKKAQEGLEEIKKQAAAFGINDISDIDTQIGALNSSKPQLEALKAGLPVEGNIDAMTAATINAVLQGLGISGINLSAGSSVEAARQALETAISAIDDSVAQLESLKSTWNTVQTTIDNLQNSINVSTMGLGADAYIAQLESTLSGIEKNIAKLDQALTELYKGNLTAAH